MTTVVGILNKEGVALAADSAATIGGRVYHSANKIFRLSRYQPVAIAIYDNAEFMGIPWEVIIKEYRKELGDRPLATLHAYHEHFVAWIEQKNLFLRDRISNDDWILDAYLGLLSHLLPPTPATVESDVLPDFLERLAQERDRIEQIPVRVPLSEVDLTIIDECLASETPNISAGLQEHLKTTNETVVNTILEESKALTILYLEREWTWSQATGLIFTGYGELEIFPSIVSMKVFGSFGPKLRHQLDNIQKITVGESSLVVPFAQDDIVRTIVEGINPDLQDKLKTIVDRFLEKSLPTIVQQTQLPTKEIHSILKKLQAQLSEDFSTELQEEVEKAYKLPVLGGVEQLGKQDLAEMAENLVYMTYLNRRFTGQLEGVGGPVDVAGITKGDGFVWMKRKHYFNAKLNKHFFQKNYKTYE